MQKTLLGFFGHERAEQAEDEWGSQGRKGHCAGVKRLDIKDSANVSLELNWILASVFSRVTLNMK